MSPRRVVTTSWMKLSAKASMRSRTVAPAGFGRTLGVRACLGHKSYMTDWSVIVNGGVITQSSHRCERCLGSDGTGSFGQRQHIAVGIPQPGNAGAGRRLPDAGGILLQ